MGRGYTGTLKKPEENAKQKTRLIALNLPLLLFLGPPPCAKLRLSPFPLLPLTALATCTVCAVWGHAIPARGVPVSDPTPQGRTSSLGGLVTRRQIEVGHPLWDHSTALTSTQSQVSSKPTPAVTHPPCSAPCPRVLRFNRFRCDPPPPPLNTDSGRGGGG